MSEIPTSWIAAQLGDLIGLEMGQAPAGSKCNKDGIGTPFVKAGEFGPTNPVIREWTTSPLRFGRKGDVFLCVVGATSGKINFGIDCAIGRSVAALRPTEALAAEYLYHFLSTKVMQLRTGSTGSAQGVISKPDINSIEIPLPPLAEQKRIVAKIEELFSELEAGEESLRVVRRHLGVYRQSLLNQAFEGKLTEKWRIKNPTKLESPTDSDVPADELEDFPDLPASWCYVRFGRSIRRIDAGKSFRCEERRPTPDEIGVAKVSAVTWGEYDEAESKTCVDPERVKADYFIRSGDFILSRANTIERVGACVIVRKVTQRVMLSDKTLRLTIDDALKPFFLHYLRSRQGRREIERRSTGNQESMRNIGQERIRSIIVPECSLSEQREIVRLLDEQFEVVERNEREIDAALKRSEALRQAILKKAFSGRLVPQDPADEPASQLLARLRAGRGAGLEEPAKRAERRLATGRGT